VVKSSTDCVLNQVLVIVVIDPIRMVMSLIDFELNEGDNILKFDLKIVLYILIKSDSIEN
jgi:hypothetical protein